MMKHGSLRLLLPRPVIAGLLFALAACLGSNVLVAQAKNVALSPFPTSRREIAHGPHWTSTMEYSVAGDVAIDSIIQSLVVQDCYPGMMVVDDGRCTQSVTAKLVRDVYLVVTIERSEYQTGSPHGSDESETRTFKKAAGNWLPVASNMISVAPNCQRRIGDFVYKQIRPNIQPDIVESLDKSHLLSDIDAPQVLTEAGIVLDFQQYEFGAYVPPAPITLDWRFIGSCFHPKVHPPG
jgi:hypothetical protein